ncbi:DUF4397 domain-containing protein [Clostridium gasigenes]|uniref:DUF4397 domain-containing protein n=1 Tax=Clostridium gasigenes TaxID=94869 RepID=UPI001C0B42D3|nr:DUF4397 domain-containing protein [Clostridium gasigenes]MBU3088681.1 DUF4397 domain-containing protein [Clostridium gasigenes]
MNFYRETLPNSQSRLRLIHALPEAGSIDVYANGELIAKRLLFGKVVPYLQLNPGSYEIQLYPSGLYDNPLFTKTINLLPNSASTVSIITFYNSIDLFLLNDSTSGPSISNSFLRFIHLSPNSPLLTLSLLNNVPLFSNVEYVETTGYYPLSPGIYNFRVTLSSLQAISQLITNLRLLNGQFYTIYIIGLFNNTPPLGYLVLRDSL